jgi:hypothetical protein
MAQKPSLAKQLSPLRFLDDLLPLHRSPSSLLLHELEVEYAELELTSLAPTIARALPQCDNPPRKIPNYCLNQSTLVIKQ